MLAGEIIAPWPGPAANLSLKNDGFVSFFLSLTEGARINWASEFRFLWLSASRWGMESMPNQSRKWWKLWKVGSGVEVGLCPPRFHPVLPSRWLGWAGQA